MITMEWDGCPERMMADGRVFNFKNLIWGEFNWSGYDGDSNVGNPTNIGADLHFVHSSKVSKW